MSTHQSLKSVELVEAVLACVENRSTHFETLGIPVGSDAATVKSTFVRLARSLHPDLPVFDSDEAKARATRAFQALTRAQPVLTDPVRREEYLHEIGFGATGKDVDEPNPDLAEIHVHRGKQCAAKRDWAGAQANFERAIALSGDRVEDLHKVELGWAIFQNTALDEIERADRSYELFDEVIKEREDPAAVAQAHYCMAVWCKLNDEVPAVKKHLEKCLAIDEKHVHARRELRLFERRRSSASYKRVTGSHPKAKPERKSRATRKLKAVEDKEEAPTDKFGRPEVKKVRLKKKVSLLERLFGKGK